MTNFIPTAEVATEFGDFYVPRFELRIAGADLPGEVLRDVTDVSYTDDIEKIDGFQLTVNNWNEVAQTFKYLGAGESPEQEELERIFDPCNKDVALKFGYGDQLELMVTGNFTTIEPHFPGSSAPTLTVRGLNVLHQLRRKQYTYAWTDQTDSQIAENLATLTDRESGRRRFPVPIVTDPPEGEPEIAYVAQRNQYDIDFLFQRARERGYVVTTRPRQNARNQDAIELYFGPSEGATVLAEQPAYELAWRKGLIDFQPTLTTANRASSVTVNGWNRTTRRAISERVHIDDRRLNINGDLRRRLGNCDRTEEVVVDEPVFTPRQARERAFAILRDQEYARVKATGTCVGFPGLRAGRKVKFLGLGSTFSGVYLLVSTTHTINDGGYTVSFEARRENPDDEESGGAT